MLKNGFYQRKKLKYKNNKTLYQKSAVLRLLQVWSNLKKKTFCFAWTKNDNLRVLLYKYVKRGQKRLKKWTLSKQKLTYMNNKFFYQKSTGLRFLPVWYNLKKKKILISAKNDRFWVLLRKNLKFRPFCDFKRV